MSVNKYQPHVLILPEDDANRQMANGFVLDQNLSTRSTQVLPACGGWLAVLGKFSTEHIAGMDRHPDRRIILLIDFDGDASRRDTAMERVPARMRDRVYALGVLKEPEDLRRETPHSYEEIGRQLARECWDGTSDLWNHRLLRHNDCELARMRADIRPILFPNCRAN